VSRDPFSHDPQDIPDRRDSSARRPPRAHRPTTSNPTDTRNPSPETTGLGGRDEVREHNSNRDERSAPPRAYYLRDSSYLLRDSEMRALKEIGKFRVVSVTDLAKYGYSGDRKQADGDIRRLAKQSLVKDKTIEISRKRTFRVVTLTKAAHRLLKNTNQLPDNQPSYHGLRKPREIKHDADLYRLYQKEAARIEGSGGRPVRVLLDYELKRNLNRDLALLGPEKDDPGRKSQIAQKHHLRVVNGKIPVPDLRVDYETSESELRHVDLELATREYRPRAMAEKAAAGFSFYGRSEDAARLRRVLDEREITAQILTL
jgi:hypothetical protein